MKTEIGGVPFNRWIENLALLPQSTREIIIGTLADDLLSPLFNVALANRNMDVAAEIEVEANRRGQY